MSLELWFLGQAGFRLRPRAGRPSVFIDPYLSPHAGRTWEAPISPSDLAQADAIFCTHDHIDHFDRPALQAAAAEPGAHFALILPQPIVEQARELGIPEERIFGVQPCGEQIIAGVRFWAVPASHGQHVADAYNFGEQISGGKIRYLGYVIELGDVRVYHGGDTIVYPDQVAIIKELKPDLALLPINGRDYFREHERDIVGNLNPREAARLAVEMGVQMLVPMHWDIFPHNAGFPGDLADYVSRYFPELTLLIPGRGAKINYG